MKNFCNLSRLIIPLLILSLFISTTSCDKEKPEERPDLPPVESLVMSFGDFQQNPGDAKSPDFKGIPEGYEHFGRAFTTVAFWNLIMTGSVAIPVASYSYALQHSPEYIGDDRWQWTYDFSLLQVGYKATLTAKRLGSETFSLRMEIAPASDADNKFKYFDATVRYDHSHAEWNIYGNNSGTSVKVLEVVWDKDFSTGDYELEYTYVESGQAETNSSITFSKTNSADYDMAYTIDMSAGTVLIEWDSATKAGRISDSVFFSDSGEWHCWNDLLIDIECPV